ncbi:PhzF family phenazine biosynthesis protein [Pseudoxanthomonas sp. z9]|uniref:PhzF family phenazine biosynthesis protein n=1 Tax=Pseudoxanthomonas sp. z9 TaxID=2584942 RepID=UPI0011416C68|nr:PhzF family phenazine biosynthesis protein [Pseudoxanthomonas sp. z9]MCL6713946.1 PhzF family phenazine biosynthesis protein [Pseudomonas sp. R2.Fl]
MRPRRYLQLDVFADRPGAGNPLGVVLDAADLDTAAMQAFAAWTRLSETIFFLPPTSAEADYRIRIFTPRRELPFAGHPSIGAAWAALETGLAPETGALVQECEAGLLPVRVEGRGAERLVRLRAPAARPQPVSAPVHDLLAAVLARLPLGPLPAALWNNGPAWWLVELADADAVRALAPDLPAIDALSRASGAIGLAVFGQTAANQKCALAVRAFCPADDIPEDPVTGSANAAIGAMLHAAGRFPDPHGRYIASQGRELGRDGQVTVELDAAGDIWIGGQVQAVIAGSATW